jgi:predicted  nucleic acid-binding Zn-ribbon protein
MQLHVARLCLDCEDVHDQQMCPQCGSESFAYISRWVPAPERRTQPRDVPSREAADIYRQLLNPTPQASNTKRWVKRGVVGLGVAAIAGWAWRGKSSAR